MQLKGLTDTTKLKAVVALANQIKKNQPNLTNKEAFDLALRQLS